MDEIELKEAVETILFTSAKSLSPKKISDLTNGKFTVKEIRLAVKKLNEDFKKTGRIFIIDIVSDGYLMRTISRCSKWIKKIDSIKTIKLSIQLMETLSIIAYKQPITRNEIEFIRGVDSSYSLRKLINHKLIRIVGREMMPGKPSLYGTTKYFLEVFGLINLKHLPDIKEFSEDLSTPNDQLEMNLN